MPSLCLGLSRHACLKKKVYFYEVQFYGNTETCGIMRYVISFYMILNLKNNLIDELILIHNIPKFKNQMIML